MTGWQDLLASPSAASHHASLVRVLRAGTQARATILHAAYGENVLDRMVKPVGFDTLRHPGGVSVVQFDGVGRRGRRTHHRT